MADAPHSTSGAPLLDGERLCPVAPLLEGHGGIVRDGEFIEARNAKGGVIDRARLPKSLAALPEDAILTEYRVCDLLPAVTWYIGRPFLSEVRYVVDYKLNGHECTGELLIPGHVLPYSWEIIVSKDLAYFDLAELPNYQFDISFPFWRVHEHQDIVLRRRLVDELEQFACAGQGRFKVSRGEEHAAIVSNLFSGRPDGRNRPHISTLGQDLYQTRKSGKTNY